jgi:pimeloyl-ACP methyl ester carboxylesterase
MSAITLESEIIHYEVLGRGRPLLFLHDWIGSWRYWIPAMQAASISFRAYALDFWGFGDTSKNPEYYALSKQAELIDGFMDQMGIGKLALVGHGLGAVVALIFARSKPSLVDRVMITGFPLRSEAVNTRLSASAPTDLVDWLLERVPELEPVRLETAKADPRAIQASLDDLQNTDLRNLFMQAPLPCLLVHGINDPVVEVPSQESLADLPDRLHSIIFEQSGHYPMLDEPSKYNRLLNDFLALTSGESPTQLQLKEEWKRRVR